MCNTVPAFFSRRCLGNACALASSALCRPAMIEVVLARLCTPERATLVLLMRNSPGDNTEERMATDSGRSTRKGAVKKRSQRQTKLLGQKRWTKRSRASGEFMSQKKPGAKKYKGVRREAKRQG